MELLSMCNFDYSFLLTKQVKNYENTRFKIMFCFIGIISGK